MSVPSQARQKEVLLDRGLHPQVLSQSGEENLPRETCPRGRPWERVLRDEQSLSEPGPADGRRRPANGRLCGPPRGAPGGGRTPGRQTLGQEAQASCCALRKLPRDRRGRDVLAEGASGQCSARTPGTIFAPPPQGAGRPPASSVLPSWGFCSDVRAAFPARRTPKPPTTFFY